MRFQVEILDTWNMTIAPVEGAFKIIADDPYRYHAEGSRNIELSGNPYLSIRIRRVEGER